MAHWTDPLVLVGIGSAAIALLYVILTGLIWHATWQNTRATRQVLEAAYRPYLAISDIKTFEESSYKGGPISIAVIITNVGSVPSQNINIEMKATYPDASVHIERANEDAESALFPGHPLSVSFRPTAEQKTYLFKGGIEVTVSVHYQGVADTQYSTSGTYRLKDYESGFCVVSGRFQ